MDDSALRPNGPPSPDQLLLDAWRRAEAASSSIYSALPPPPQTTEPVFGAVDRVLSDALRVKMSRAEARADAQASLAQEQRHRTSQVESELDEERSSSARLRARTYPPTLPYWKN